MPEIITQSVLHGPQTDSNGKQNAYDTNILSFASRCCIHKQIPVNGEGFVPDLQGKKRGGVLLITDNKNDIMK